jgi:DNA-damage-inducible protein J
MMSSRETRKEGGNVFADIGVPNAEEHFVKAQLVFKIDSTMKEHRMRQVDAARRLGIRQPDVSKMLRGEFRQFSVETLLRFLVAPGKRGKVRHCLMFGLQWGSRKSDVATNSVVRARIDERTKREAAAALKKIGLTVSDAFRLLLVRVAAEKALPFEPLNPNAETVAAMKAARRGELVKAGKPDKLLQSLNAGD